MIEPHVVFLFVYKSISNQKEILEEIWNNGLLTSEEYNDKYGLLKDQEKELDSMQKQSCLNYLVMDQIEPMVSNLEVLFKSGLLNEIELESKKKKLFENRFKLVTSVPYLNQLNSSIIETIEPKSLKPWVQSELNLMVPNLKYGEVILFNKETKELNKVSNLKWIELHESNKLRNYYYIYIPNLFEI